MAFNIPDKAFLSFGRKQCIDTLWRICKQIDQHWDKEAEREKSLIVLKRYLNLLKTHRVQQIVEKSVHLLKIFPTSEEQLQFVLMELERENQIDLKDSDFLISTKDTEQKINEKVVPVHIVLDNLRSSFNVGSIFRTAEALGIKEVHLCGYTPTPDNAKTKKSALGTDNWIKWTYWESTLECLENLNKNKIHTYSFETESNAEALETFVPKYPCAIILGNEKYGLASPVLNLSEKILKISLRGKKNSLNVGTCGAIAMNYLVQSFDSTSC